MGRGGGGGEGGFSMNSTGQRPVWRHGSGNQNRHPTNSVVINVMIALKIFELNAVIDKL